MKNSNSESVREQASRIPRLHDSTTPTLQTRTVSSVSGFLNLRVLVTFTLFFIGALPATLSLAATASSAAQVGTTCEIESAADGRSVRSVLLEVNSAENIASESAPATQGSGAILWIDRNHQNAIAHDMAITGDGR